MLSVSIPLRLGAALNSREHWRARSAATRHERAISRIVLGSRDRDHFARALEREPSLRIDVELVRVAPRLVDSDNLQGQFKAVRDGVADFLGIDDATPRIVWRYEQERRRPKEYLVEIRIRRLDA